MTVRELIEKLLDLPAHHADSEVQMDAETRNIVVDVHPEGNVVYITDY